MFKDTGKKIAVLCSAATICEVQGNGNFDIYVKSGINIPLQNGTVFETGAAAQENLRRVIEQSTHKAMTRPEKKEL